MLELRICTLTLFCGVLGGCGSPVVKYTPINAEDNYGLVKFRFAESVIGFNFGKTSAGIQNEDIVISSVPILMRLVTDTSWVALLDLRTRVQRKVI
jgi:hypothetical protein